MTWHVLSLAVLACHSPRVRSARDLARTRTERPTRTTASVFSLIRRRTVRVLTLRIVAVSLTVKTASGALAGRSRSGIGSLASAGRVIGRTTSRGPPGGRVGGRGRRGDRTPIERPGARTPCAAKRELPSHLREGRSASLEPQLQTVLISAERIAEASYNYVLDMYNSPGRV